jgi:hypothetical protein
VQESAFGIESLEEQLQTLRVSLTLSYHDIVDEPFVQRPRELISTKSMTSALFFPAAELS